MPSGLATAARVFADKYSEDAVLFYDLRSIYATA
jgi:hypothetical protein